MADYSCFRRNQFAQRIDQAKHILALSFLALSCKSVTIYYCSPSISLEIYHKHVTQHAITDIHDTLLFNSVTQCKY